MINPHILCRHCIQRGHVCMHVCSSCTCMSMDIGPKVCDMDIGKCSGVWAHSCAYEWCVCVCTGVGLCLEAYVLLSFFSPCLLKLSGVLNWEPWVLMFSCDSQLAPEILGPPLRAGIAAAWPVLLVFWGSKLWPTRLYVKFLTR